VLYLNQRINILKEKYLIVSIMKINIIKVLKKWSNKDKLTEKIVTRKKNKIKLNRASKCSSKRMIALFNLVQMKRIACFKQ
jgi:hypothetical protein